MARNDFAVNNLVALFASRSPVGGTTVHDPGAVAEKVQQQVPVEIATGWNQERKTKQVCQQSGGEQQGSRAEDHPRVGHLSSGKIPRAELSLDSSQRVKTLASSENCPDHSGSNDN